MRIVYASGLTALIVFALAVPGFGQQMSPGGTHVMPAQAPQASPVPPAPSAQPVGQAVSPDYQIGPGDNLQINVFNQPNFSGTLPVRPDGMISLNLIGDLQAAGSTPMHLSTQIADHLRKYITDPSVTVTVLGVNSKQVFLLGEISKPGPLPLTPGLSPLQAIASAGGLSQYASETKIYILRTTGGKREKIPFNYKKAIKNGDLQGVTLAPGDTIVVP